MSGARARDRGLPRIHLAVAAALALLATAAQLVASPPPVAAAGGRTDVATTTYTLEPEATRLSVTIVVTVTNDTPTPPAGRCATWGFDFAIGFVPVTTPCATARSTISETYVWLESEAVGERVAADSGTARIDLVQAGFGYDLYRVSFAPIGPDAERRLTVRYSIAGGGHGSDSAVRIGRAFASFCMVANGFDSGLTELVVPSAVEVLHEAHNGTLTTSQSGGQTTYSSGELDEPLSFWACVLAEDPAGFLTESFESPSGRTIQLQAWPEDPGWSDEVRDEVVASLTELEALIGRGLPGDGPIIIREASTGELGAYAGVFDPETSVARVSEVFEPGTIAHELAHAWFNDSLFVDRWLSEGSAEWARTAVVGEPCEEPGEFPGDGRPHIAVWEFAGPRATRRSLEVVQYQYAAACHIVATLAEAVGPDAMREILGTLIDGELAYQRDGLALEDETPGTDWREWLDAIEELGLAPAGEDDDELAQELVAAFGAATETSFLPARSRARADYRALADSLGDWAVPEAVLRALGEWQFVAATEAMASASHAYALAQEIDAAYPEADASNGVIREQVETAKLVSELHAAEDLAAAQRDAALAMAEAAEAVAAPRDALATVGLLGTSTDGWLDAGTAAVIEADAETAMAEAARIQAVLADAPRQGMLRIVGLVAGVVVLAFVAAVVVTRRAATSSGAR